MTVFVTGGMGCIGAWVLYHLAHQQENIVCFDLSDDRHRLDLLLTPEEQAAITFVKGDITNFEQIRNAFSTYDVTHVIHLAALQVPMCKQNPILGAQVNVVGTTNIFEAARHTDIKHLAYASSIAVYGSPEKYPTPLIDADSAMLPGTLYGVYKVANEGTAKIYWQDHNISSTVLRPYTVYGLGRDQGLTSEPTKAMQAAASGQDYHISFGGRMQFHFASDVAQQFILAAKTPLDGSNGFNLGTTPVLVQEVANIIIEIVPSVNIAVDERPLPFPEGCDPEPLHSAFTTVYETPLREGIEKTILSFQGQ